jgi:hypothetical protein
VSGFLSWFLLVKVNEAFVLCVNGWSVLVSAGQCWSVLVKRSGLGANHRLLLVEI